jgi:glycosyltransferase involved in cell wall biosynthesis
MKFSIVTTCRNAAHFLPDCIASVKSQTGVDWEHIIVDAASTDGTVELLKSHPHLQWISEPDSGMSEGINKGFTRATGDWVMWLNADDYLEPGALEKVARHADGHDNADVIFGGWHFVDAEKRRIKTSMLFPVDRRMLIYYGAYIASTACFFRRSTVVQDGFLLDHRFYQVMDNEYYLRLIHAGKVFSYLAEPLASFRIHGENSSMRSMKARDLGGILRQQKLWAESHALRRFYGWTPTGSPMIDGVFDAFIWGYFRWKKVFLKLLHGSYR